MPMADIYVQDISRRLGRYSVRQRSDYLIEAENELERVEINLKENTCSCRRWQVTGLHRIHVASFISSKNPVRED